MIVIEDLMIVFFSMIRAPPRSTRNDTIVPYPKRFRSEGLGIAGLNEHSSRNTSGGEERDRCDQGAVRFEANTTTDHDGTERQRYKGVKMVRCRSEEHTSEL